MFGYPRQQIDEILGSDAPDLWAWMSGQTATICNGRIYNRSQGRDEPTGCGPHGLVVYGSDLRRYLSFRE
jgi:hypothetical protein